MFSGLDGPDSEGKSNRLAEGRVMLQKIELIYCVEMRI